MIRSPFLALSALVCSCALEGAETQPITELDAAVIVRAEEIAREEARDVREADLLAAKIFETATVGVGGRRIVFNQITVPEGVPEADCRRTEMLHADADQVPQHAWNLEEIKPHAGFSLSGQVWDDGAVSELWWTHGAVRYRIFTNANCLYFQGVGAVESEDVSFSIFSMITEATSRQADGARPAGNTFAAGQVEYLLIEPTADDAVDPKALAPVEAMLRHYAANHAAMKIDWENARKLEVARSEYLKANPPKVRDVIVNFRPAGSKASR